MLKLTTSFLRLIQKVRIQEWRMWFDQHFVVSLLLCYRVVIWLLGEVEFGKWAILGVRSNVFSKWYHIFYCYFWKFLKYVSWFAGHFWYVLGDSLMQIVSHFLLVCLDTLKVAFIILFTFLIWLLLLILDQTFYLSMELKVGVGVLCEIAHLSRFSLS